MKIASLLAGASLALNAVLIVTLIGHVASADDATEPSAVKSAAPAPAARKPVATAEVWAETEAGDLTTQVERLRAEGFPPATIRAIMAARVKAQFAARRKALEGATLTPYWESAYGSKDMVALMALDREERKILRDLLGTDPTNTHLAQVKRIFPNMPEDRLEQIAAMRERFNDERSDYFMGTRGAMAGDNRKIDEMEKAFHDRLAAVLSPQELQEYDLRESRVAQQLRYSLAAFDATEQEYRAIFKIQSDFEAQYGRNYDPDMSQEAMKVRSQAQAQMKEQIKTALGDARYADYERGTDANYRRTTQLVARLNLPPETANDLYSVQQDTQKRATEIRRAVPTEPGGVPAALAALATEAEARIAAKLGPAGLEAYKTNNIGSWPNNLTPRPTRPAAGVPAALMPKQ